MTTAARPPRRPGSPRPVAGPNGERYLAGGVRVGMRLFEGLQPHAGEAEHTRDYETAGYCTAGHAQLVVGEDAAVDIAAGTSYLIPARAPHRFVITQGPFSAVEACSPLPWVHDRDRPAPRQPQQAQPQQPRT